MGRKKSVHVDMAEPSYFLFFAHKPNTSEMASWASSVQLHATGTKTVTKYTLHFLLALIISCAYISAFYSMTGVLYGSLLSVPTRSKIRRMLNTR